MSEMIDALKDLLHREWGETSEVSRILQAIEEQDHFQQRLSHLSAVNENLLDGYRLILQSDCCPKYSHHGNTCPKWIAEEALKIAEEMEEK